MSFDERLHHIAVDYVNDKKNDQKKNKAFIRVLRKITTTKK